MPPLWEELAKGVRWAPAVHVVALHNLAVATLQGGRPRAALSIMECLLASGWVDKGALAGMRLDVLTAKGVAHAVVGEVDAVEALRERAQLLLGEGRRGATMLLDTMIGAPRGTLRADPTPDQLRLAESALPPISSEAAFLVKVLAFNSLRRYRESLAMQSKRISSGTSLKDQGATPGRASGWHEACRGAEGRGDGPGAAKPRDCTDADPRSERRRPEHSSATVSGRILWFSETIDCPGGGRLARGGRAPRSLRFEWWG